MAYRLLFYILFSIGAFSGMVNLTMAATKLDPAQATPLRYELLLDEEARYYHVLPGSEQQWKVIAEEFVNLFSLTTEYFITLAQTTGEALQQSTALQLLLGVILLTLWWSISYGVTWLSRQADRHQLFSTRIDKTFIGKVVFYLGQLWLRNIWLLVSLGSIAWILIYLQIPNLGILFSLFGVLIATKFAINIARIILFENLSDHAGHDVRFYRILKWAFAFVGLLTALTVLAHLMPISVYMVGFIDRLFLLVLLIFSIALLKNWRVIPLLFQPYVQRRYLQRAISVLAALVPLVLISTAVIGLVGYVVLAWRIGVAEVKLIIVIIGWILARGLVNDMMNWVSDFFIQRMPNGWLWTEAVLKPLRRLFNLFLLLLVLVVLLWVYGFQEGSLLIAKIRSGIQYEIFSISGTKITVAKFILFGFILAVVIWMAKWSREFAYRWLFSGTKDYGLRNTFAVFTQYSAVFIGCIIVLRVLGIDLTTLTVVLGALSLGIGIGLQSLANSLVSGLILLIERPLQVGDLIKIADNEGEVTRIGMRSITINSWDHKEVIVPNADALSLPIINWTHRDNVVRVMSVVRIGFEQDPHMIRSIIMQVLTEHIGVLSEPAPEVFLTGFGETAMMFEVRFFIDMRSRYVTSFSAIRSAVLLDIWDALKRNNVTMPYPQQSVNLFRHKEDKFANK
jgi:potassium efflux system protein